MDRLYGGITTSIRISNQLEGLILLLTYKTGDLIEAMKSGEVEAIGHQANCFHVMKSGIAPLISKAWFPTVTLADIKTPIADKSKMGSFSVAETGDGLVYNIYGQYHFDRRQESYGTHYDSLGMGLRAVRADLDSRKVLSVGFPRIGCGLAGGDWGFVSGLIEDAFKDFDGRVTIYSLKE